MAAGLSRRELLSSRFTRLRHGVYVSAEVPVDDTVRARAALLFVPAGSVVGGALAARLWGGVAPHVDRVLVELPPGARCEASGVSCVAARGTPTMVRRGVPVTSPEGAFVGSATQLGLIDLTVLGDSLVAAGHTTAEGLLAASGALSGKGIRVARRAAACVREGVDSPPESRLRMLLVLGGLPEPVVNLMSRHEDGGWRMRLDLAYPDQQVAVEYDGRQHAESTRQRNRDLARREELDRLGWRLIVVTASDLSRAPDRVLERVRAVLAERGLRVAVHAGWRAHFTPWSG